MAATRTRTAPPTMRLQRVLPRIGTQAFLVLMTVIFLAPVIWAILSAFKPPADIIRYPLVIDPSRFTWVNYLEMVKDIPIAQGFLNTGIVLLFKGSMTMFFAPLAAFGFAKYTFWGKNLIFGAVLITLMLPPWC